MTWKCIDINCCFDVTCTTYGTVNAYCMSNSHSLVCSFFYVVMRPFLTTESSLWRLNTPRIYYLNDVSGKVAPILITARKHAISNGLSKKKNVGLFSFRGEHKIICLSKAMGCICRALLSKQGCQLTFILTKLSKITYKFPTHFKKCQ